MNYKSFRDLAADISRNLHRIPDDVDLIVGVPRSGLMAASLLALQLNRKFCDVETFVENRAVHTGSTRRPSGGDFLCPHDANRVLVIDDSVLGGTAITAVRERLEKLVPHKDVVYAAVYATSKSRKYVDAYFDLVETPRYFEWNLFHRKDLERFCLDIDGVLCVDPSTSENDDGARYREFLLSTKRLARPTYKVGHLVTSRLEKYRAETTQWLKRSGIDFGVLHMLDLPSAEQRRRQGIHGKFKAEVYRSLRSSDLFIESESSQAYEIAKLSGKPVLDYSTQSLVRPEWSLLRLSAECTNMKTEYADIPNRAIRKLARLLRLGTS